MIKRFFAPQMDSDLTSLGLLLLRVWLGATMMLNHGWPKLTGYSQTVEKFPSLLGLSPAAGLVLATFAEFFCSILLVAGLCTRFAALALSITMLVAFALAHKMALSGPQSGEMAFIYLAGFVTILVAGPGRFSVDQRLFGPVAKHATNSFSAPAGV